MLFMPGSGIPIADDSPSTNGPVDDAVDGRGQNARVATVAETPELSPEVPGPGPESVAEESAQAATVVAATDLPEPASEPQPAAPRGETATDAAAERPGEVADVKQESADDSIAAAAVAAAAVVATSAGVEADTASVATPAVAENATDAKGGRRHGRR